MASVQDHLDSIHRNERFLEFLKRDGTYPSWGVVVVFYIGVHYGRALVAHAGIQISTHGHFESQFVRIFNDPTCYTHIRLLKDYSEQARYDNQSFSWADVDKLYSEHLKKFKVCIKKHASTNGLQLP